MNNVFDRKDWYDIIVAIPIGPGTDTEFLIDTIQSFKFYTRASYKIILIDDSNQNVGTKIQNSIHDCDLLLSPKPMGGWAGLYINLSYAYKFALDNYDFKALLKLDTDALVIREEPEIEALKLFNDVPTAGMAGQYPSTYNGYPWNIAWPRQRILNSTASWKFIRRPLANYKLVGLHGLALKNGYVTGESVFGGAYFFSKNCLIKLNESGLLPYDKFVSLNLGEDHLFSLLTKAVGYSLNSLSDNGGPMGCGWTGLPAPPEQLIIDRKKIIHSTRFWEDMDEKAVRKFFKNKRS